MIVIKQRRRLRWRNAITHHPVATAELEFDKEDSWSPKSFSQAQEVIAKVLPSFSALPSQPDIDDFEIRVVVCEFTPGDLDQDGEVDAFDLAILLGAWGPCPPPPAECPADLNDDGQVGATDLAILLGNWTG